MKKMFFLRNEAIRNYLISVIRTLPLSELSPLSVTIKEVGRTLEQNAKFHAICEELSRRGMHWAGKKRSASEWKVLLVSGHSVATKQGAEIVPGLEGEFVNIRESTAKMSKSRSSSLIEYASAWCAENGINLEDERVFYEAA